MVSERETFLSTFRRLLLLLLLLLHSAAASSLESWLGGGHFQPDLPQYGSSPVSWRDDGRMQQVCEAEVREASAAPARPPPSPAVSGSALTANLTVTARACPAPPQEPLPGVADVLHVAASKYRKLDRVLVVVSRSTSLRNGKRASNW